ncbi:MAG TPA: formyltetrahydrofolate deformylase, partial [Candidatus Hydrogenedentes bacterium]|nr:formyltetrahydrofolate deformylase [Candidatus Hydrogenedentota bacterium]
CLYDLLLRHQYGEINADFALIVSNHRTLEPVAETFGVPFFYAPVTAETKDASENKALDLFQAHRVDFIVLARYMQILSETFISRYQHRIINVHHGLLPAFKGARPYHQAYEHGVKIIGATSHYATADLDMGPIIEQQTVRVDHTHSEETLVAMGRDIERNVLSAAVKAHADDRIMVYRRRTIVFR